MYDVNVRSPYTSDKLELTSGRFFFTSGYFSVIFGGTYKNKGIFQENPFIFKIPFSVRSGVSAAYVTGILSGNISGCSLFTFRS
jgi:hypothetical protein